jgi:hypothetical protein
MKNQNLGQPLDALDGPNDREASKPHETKNERRGVSSSLKASSSPHGSRFERLREQSGSAARRLSSVNPSKEEAALCGAARWEIAAAEHSAALRQELTAVRRVP